MADLGEKQDLLQKNGPVSIWDWGPSPSSPLLHFSDDEDFSGPGKVYFERSHGASALFALSSLLDIIWVQGWVLLPLQLRRFGFSLQPFCWEEEHPPSPCLGDGERRDKGEQLFAER